MLYSSAESLCSPDKKALKIIRIQEKAITVLTVSDEYVGHHIESVTVLLMVDVLVVIINVQLM